MSELILQKLARDLCRREGNAWSLKDFENGVPGVTMLTVVADEKKPLGIAGVMGGWDTMITPETKNILVEAAWFEDSEGNLVGLVPA